jgi:uncharacterized Zn finger protein
MTLPHVTEPIIHQYSSDESFERGREYYRHGAVLSLVQRGQVLHAEVQGSDVLPYRVQCAFHPDGTVSATCTCPYDWGGWCKHIVATCLATIQEPERIEGRPALEELLSRLDRKRLRTLVLTLAERDPTLTDVIEQFVGEPQSPRTRPASPQQAQVDGKAIRHRVRSILHSLDRMRSSDAYWHVSGVVNEVRQVLEQGWTLLQADDGRSALTLLDALTEAYLTDWTILNDSDGEPSGFFRELGPAWTEAVLSADLSPRERKAWAHRLETWQRAVDDYGVEEVFAAAQQAAREGWDDQGLQGVFQGTPTDVGSWERGTASKELTDARLHVLERRARFSEYLALARATRHHDAYVTMLVRLGRTQEAAAYGREHLETVQEALILARALSDRGEREQGLQIAEHGLTLQGSRGALAMWLREEAASMGKMTQALAAAEVAFREELSLANYLRVAELAGARWPEQRVKLLDDARHATSYVPQGQIDVFLHEGLIDDAIAAVEPYGTSTLLQRVVEAARLSRPEWVIQTCKRQAEQIMDEGKAHDYRAAAKWLTNVRAAYQEMGREVEWNRYLAGLLEQHRRKYKLVPMLEALH